MLLVFFEILVLRFIYILSHTNYFGELNKRIITSIFVSKKAVNYNILNDDKTLIFIVPGIRPGTQRRERCLSTYL